MRYINIVLLLLFSSLIHAQVGNNQYNKENEQSLDSLGTQVMKLMEFFESYDDRSSESQKKAKYEDAIDEMSGGAATENDKDDAYKIIDAYINSDKVSERDNTQQSHDVQSVDDMLKDTDEVKNALEYLDQQETMLMQMSYPEFEAYILKLNPAAGKKDIKAAYNEMHKNNGSQVLITADDKQLTETELQMWAIDAIQNPKDFSEFSKAYKVLKPSVTEKEVLKAWATYEK